VVNIRRDIEGLRALSIALVVGYHYFPSAIPGGYIGVDVFFVISGYLITGSLLHAAAQRRPWSEFLMGFWARRAKRLLPNAFAVLVVSAVCGFLILSDYSLKRLGSDIFGAAVYAVNWLYVLRSIDYLQWDQSRQGILLNYWSLAVEEQFYLVWPLVLLATLRWPRLRDACRQQGLLWLTSLLVAVSLLWCVHLAATNLTQAFFASQARCWELLVGSALALVLAAHPQGLVTEISGAGLARWSWVGLGLVLASALTFSEETSHPGWITLLPVSGCLILVVAGLGAESSLVPRLLGWTPLQYLGSRSYSVYLWHWPVLVLWGLLPVAQFPGGRWLALAVSWALAEAAYRWIESPGRFKWFSRWSARRVLALAVLSSASMAMLGMGLRATSVSTVHEWLSLKSEAGAMARQLPAMDALANDVPAVYAAGCHLAVAVAVSAECDFGDRRAAQSLVLFGDSHAAQWFPALDLLAQHQGIKLISLTKSSCPSADVAVWNEVTRSRYEQCDVWRQGVMRRLRQTGPDWVVLSNLIEDPMVLMDRRSGHLLRGKDASREWRDGMVRTVREIRSMGIRVIVLRDTPRPRPDVMDCLYSANTPDRCALTLAEAQPSRPLDIEAAQLAGAAEWDLTQRICPDETCPVLVPGREGWQVVYRDSNHLTASFVRTLAPFMEADWPHVGAAAR
jgi:peptidoglycan/LPS O-acetylase OafA/YrhL